MTIRQRIELFIAGLLCFGAVYGLFYVGYEMLPDGWLPTKYWWSTPTLAVMVGVGVICVIIGVIAIGVAIGAISDEPDESDDDQPDDETEGQTQL